MAALGARIYMQPQIDRKESRGSVGEGVRSYLQLLIINLRLLCYTRAPTPIPQAAGWNNALHHRPLLGELQRPRAHHDDRNYSCPLWHLQLVNW
jgi:hypothetical protein